MEKKQELIIIPKMEKEAIYDRQLKVAAYCRVSTEDDDQIDSLKSQKKYFHNMIAKQKNWTLIDVFYDEGISGTSRKKRDGFNNMIALAEQKEIDLILTKEVSRFSRNMIDTLTIAESLRNEGIYIWFIEDDINTENKKDMEELVSIAHQAQRESERTSRRVKWGQTRKMEQGVVFGRDMLGYNVENGKLIINEDDVEVVKLIYRLYLDGDGTHVIARKLRELGYKPKDPDGNARYKNNWSNVVILRVLKNEKYVGDLLQKKTITVDPLTHAKKYNRGEEDKILIRNNHEGIIDREIWDAVQKEIKRRSPSEEQKSKHSNRYWCSGKVHCGVCGDRFVSRTKKLKTEGEVYKAWRCYKTANHGTKKKVKFGEDTIEVGCNSESINDRVLQESIKFLMDFIIQNKDEIKKEVLEEIKAVRNIKVDNRKRNRLEKQLSALEKEKTNLIRLLAKEKMKEKDYDAAVKDCNQDIENIQKQLDNIYDLESIKDKQIKEIEQYITEIDNILDFKDKESNETIFKEITEKIEVFPENIIIVYLKCLPSPIRLHYETKGRLDTYEVAFDSLEIVE